MKTPHTGAADPVGSAGLVLQSIYALRSMTARVDTDVDDPETELWAEPEGSNDPIPSPSTA